MPASKVKNLNSLFRIAATTVNTPGEKQTLKQYVSSLGNSSPSPASRTKRSKKSPKTTYKPLSQLTLERFNLHISDSYSDDDSPNTLVQEISAVLSGSADPELVGYDSENETHLENDLEIPWFPVTSNSNINIRRKEVSRDRKQKWVYKSCQTTRLQRLVSMCGDKLGSDAALYVFDKLGRETGVKEYNALMALCMENARNADNEDVSDAAIVKAYGIFKKMKQRGFPIDEETYGPFFTYLIDMGMVEEFQFFQEIIVKDYPDSVSRLAYYEMLLWVRVDNHEKIQALCERATSDDGADKSSLQENYLLAFCKTERETEVLMLLEIMDISNVSSVDLLANIFKALGAFSLESLAKKSILDLEARGDIAEGNISNFIYSYAISVPNLSIQDIILKSKNLYAELELTPSSVLYEKLIRHCCNYLKVHMALDLVDEMSEEGLTLSIDTFHSILYACEECCEYNLVHHLYAALSLYNLKPNSETFRSMISLSVKMKDFDGAYSMIKDLKKLNLMPTASMYNAIMAAHFREKNIKGGLMVFKQMEEEDVKPDSHTFSYLITNSNSEEDIIKYYDEMKRSGVQATKHIYMALINSYAACGQFEKAKQVLLDKGINVKILNEIRSVLVSSLASHGKMSDALDIYEEMKQANCNLEPRAVISLIEHSQYNGDLNLMLHLLDQLFDDWWVDGCFRVIGYCVRHKHLSPAIDLLGQLRNKFYYDEVALDVIFDEVFCQVAEMGPAYLKIGLGLLRALKDELGLTPSRKSLDFLLSACANAKDLKNSFLIWKEYEMAGLPYNVLSFVRMYQSLLAAGDHKSAHVILDEIPTDDPHVRIVVEACQTTYRMTSLTSKITKNKKGKKKKKETAMQ